MSPATLPSPPLSSERPPARSFARGLPTGRAAASKIRVLVVDDHAIVRAGIRLLLETQKDMTVVGEAEDGASALREARKTPPDVVILDIGLPDRSGIHVVRDLAEVSPRSRILMLTMHLDPAYLKAALAAGAIGYVVKRSADTDLLQAIRAAARGDSFIDRSFDASSLLEWNPPGERSGARRPARSLRRLSRRERQVFHLVVAGFTNREIAERVGIGVKSVEADRARSMAKLKLKSRAEAVQFALESGFRAPGRDGDGA